MYTSITFKFIICPNIFRKSALNFTFGQDDRLKSGFARPNSSKAVLVEISQDSPVVITQFQCRAKEP